ncbi:MAG: transglutaminase domain-containing protein [FCB group bacterium]|nr:transglutaminase domain-containing protein [FCB group bacterium]MBL7027899.1 transglutaminase domain-containing protein [Candidatus Neomarinimicrobiota bacterium]MBL7121908.1 transglutaminase domain-containing protein [Candidatus Neomarinimicrobiota bacterium]
MSLNNSLLRSSPLLIIILVLACSHQSTRPDPEEMIILRSVLKNLSSEYSNPRLVTGELSVSVKNIQTLTSDALIESNQANGIRDAELPSLHIWSSDIRDYPTQMLLSESTIRPQPDHNFIDSQYENQILYWNPSLRTETNFQITRKFRYITFDYRPEIDKAAERMHWDQIPQEIIEKYTRAERFLEQDDALVDTVFKLLENLADPISQAEAIYNWVQESMTYVYPPEQRGVKNALETLKGDCGQYSALFMTMCRIAGIPARQQSGFNFVPENTGAHVWSEIYLPVKGWVPVDATRKNGFLYLDNKRLITSIGLNIPLQHSPAWANFENSEVEDEKTDFMQMYTLASSGINAAFSSTRKVIRSVELP